MVIEANSDVQWRSHCCEFYELMAAINFACAIINRCGFRRKINSEWFPSDAIRAALLITDSTKIILIQLIQFTKMRRWDAMHQEKWNNIDRTQLTKFGVYCNCLTAVSTDCWLWKIENAYEMLLSPRPPHCKQAKSIINKISLALLFHIYHSNSTFFQKSYPKTPV